MTVIQLVQHLRPGGLETMALALGKRLSERHQVIYVSLEGSTEQLRQQWPRLNQLYPLFGLEKAAGFDRQALKRLRQLCWQHQVDWLHSHHIGPLLYGTLACLGLSTRQLHSHHDGWHLAQTKARRLTRLAQRLGKVTSVAVAQSVASEIRQQGVVVDHVIANGVDPQQFCPGDRDAARQRLGLPQQGWLYGAAARLVPVKRLHLLVDALPQLPPHAHLVIAGEGPCLAQLQQQAQQLGVAQRCHFLGLVAEPQWLYRALDCYCLCSAAEGAPMALWEAQCCNVPVLSSALGCTHNLCPDSSRIVADGDWPAALNAAMSDSIGSPRPFALQHGSLTPMANAYQQLLKEAI